MGGFHFDFLLLEIGLVWIYELHCFVYLKEHCTFTFSYSRKEAVLGRPDPMEGEPVWLLYLICYGFNVDWFRIPDWRSGVSSICFSAECTSPVQQVASQQILTGLDRENHQIPTNAEILKTMVKSKILDERVR